ncbi:GNAT family N-acetyltransferase [Paraliomyxa miuraensis]|uniref:GNAT family N-acetyltransferase n=1 Tax=Paraliomyxa miuraensis TaxID=376150 RepID=UPI00224FB70E|nr:GNAT family N-acetyltransferase [Paraliomyxa miuraensis]
MLSLPVAESSTRVRVARLGDLRALAEIRRLSWWDAYRGLVPEAALRRMDDARMVRRMAHALAQRWHVILMVEDEHERPLGYAWIGPHRERVGDHRGEVFELYLHPRAQGRGAGKQLLVTAIWSLVEQGLHPVIVWVLAANPACRFYEACGGVRVAEGPVDVGGRVLTRVAYGWSDAFPLPLS